MAQAVVDSLTGTPRAIFAPAGLVVLVMIILLLRREA